MLMKKQNPIRAHPATKIRYFSDRLLVIGIRADDDEDEVLQTYRASLRALRPQLVGAIAADADRVLAEKYEEAA